MAVPFSISFSGILFLQRQMVQEVSLGGVYFNSYNFGCNEFLAATNRNFIFDSHHHFCVQVSCSSTAQYNKKAINLMAKVLFHINEGKLKNSIPFALLSLIFLFLVQCIFYHPLQFLKLIPLTYK